MFTVPTLVVNETSGISTENPFVLSNIKAVIDSHAVKVDGVTTGLDTDCLVKVCLGCGSIAMAADREQRDLNAAWYSFECHGHQTYTFLSHDSGLMHI